MRTKRTIVNFIASIVLQILNGISGLIVPALMIRAYGSEINGLVSSITQFLSYISFLEAGLTGVIMSQLYKPLANHNNNEINEKLADTRDFFQKVAVLFILYTIALTFIYPNIIDASENNLFIGTLIIILSVSFLFRYLFGIVSSILIQADQRGYIYSAVQSFVVIATIFVTVIGIKLEFSLHLLKIFTVLASLANPLGLYLYVKKKYPFYNTKLKGNSKNLSQRWDGMVHHVCYFVQTNIDVMILTFVDLKLVSVYTVYHMVMMLIQRLFEAFILSFRSGLGDLYARGNKEKIGNIFSMLEFLVYSLSAVCFSSLLFSLFPFIKIYIGQVKDVDYISIPFGILMIIAELAYTIRIPYHAMVNSAGVFRETRRMAIEEALINIIVSIIAVYRFGIVGVAVGTAISCIFRTIRYYVFFHNNVLYLKTQNIILRIVALLISMGVSILIFYTMKLESSTYLVWAVHGLIYILISSIITGIVFILLFKTDFNQLISYIKMIFNRRN